MTRAEIHIYFEGSREQLLALETKLNLALLYNEEVYGNTEIDTDIQEMT